MPAEESKEVIRRWFEEVWNKGREEAIGEMFAPEGIAHGLAGDGGEIRGPEAFKSFHRGFRDAFPDIRVTVEDVVAEGDKLAARCSVVATHTGEGIGMAPTGGRVSFEGMCLVRVEGGRIVEAWNSFDFMTMFRQLGAIQPPA